VGIFAGLFLPILGPVSQSIKVTPAAIIAVGALVVLLLICIQLSIAISTLQEQSRTLAEQIAHLQSELMRGENENMDSNKDAR
jgi:CHASE1-domain containing sensor protein